MRVTFDEFTSGLSISPPEDKIGKNALRRARGVGNIITKSIRSREGSKRLWDLDAHSLYRFANKRYAGVGTILYEDGVSIKTGLSGNQLYFLRMPPTSEVEDYLFCAGGGELFKVDRTGNVTQWGIDAPEDGFVATKGTMRTKTIDLFEGGADARWTESDCTDANDGTNYVEGAQSLAVTVAASTTAVLYQDVDLDLSEFSDGTESSHQDYIVFQFRCDNPAAISYLQLDFSLGDTTYAHNVLSAKVQIEGDNDFDLLEGTETFFAGIADLEEYLSPNQEKESQLDFQFDAPEDLNHSRNWHHAVTKGLESKTITAQKNAWKQVRISKQSFSRQGEDTYYWADVKSVKITIKTNSVSGGVVCNFDALQLAGGTGLQGNYKYQVTYLNNTTGTRSNPNPTPVRVKKVKRHRVSLTNLPVSTDPQVSHVEIWRTVGNGSVLFYVDKVANGVTTYLDEVADTYAMDTRAGVSLLASKALVWDNIVPPSGYFACEYFNASVFWCRNASGRKGNLYYSPVGRVEGVQGFVRLSSDDDPLYRPIEWNGSLYVFSEGRVFQVAGTNPYVARTVYGCPGTRFPRTIVGTPYGIVYQAADGIRLFNGLRSVPLGLEEMGRIFRGESSENLTEFVGQRAAYAREEYIISDGTQTLALNLRTSTWRDLGIGLSAICTEYDTQKVLASFDDKVALFEENGELSDSGDAIEFCAQTATAKADVDKHAMLNWIYVDVDTNGQVLNPTLVTDSGDVVLGQIVTTARETVVFPVNKEVRRAALRLEGSLTNRVEIFEVTFDVSEPGLTT